MHFCSSKRLPVGGTSRAHCGFIEFLLVSAPFALSFSRATVVLVAAAVAAATNFGTLHSLHTYWAHARASVSAARRHRCGGRAPSRGSCILSCLALTAQARARARARFHVGRRKRRRRKRGAACASHANATNSCRFGSRRSGSNRENFDARARRRQQPRALLVGHCGHATRYALALARAHARTRAKEMKFAVLKRRKQKVCCYLRHCRRRCRRRSRRSRSIRSPARHYARVVRPPRT